MQEIKVYEQSIESHVRKKEGVFYTPNYIVKYMISNTLGKLCEEKRNKFSLEKYQEWLLELSIVDPASGAGIFLLEAFDFLKKEHDKISHQNPKLKLENIEKRILVQNIFGVDIDEKAISLAQRLFAEKINIPKKELKFNLKIGNSLIDDPKIAGEKAFDWYKEFPQVFPKKEKEVFHITWVTHNSRTSERMIQYKVKKGDTFWLKEEYELKITEFIRDIVKENELNILAYNICGDHIHILIVAEGEEIPNIVRKLKGKTSQKLKEYLQIPKEEKFTLWAQKYNKGRIDSEKQLWNTVNYIRNNRLKHELPTNKGLQPLVQEICCTYDYAFRTEYKGGFDVVIGNLPYVVVKDKSLYPSYEWKTDLYLLFIEKVFKGLLKKQGLLSFITPRYFMVNKVNQALRIFMLKEKDLVSLVETAPFADANTECVISIFKNQKTTSDIIEVYEDKDREIEKINHVRKSFFLRNGHNEILTYLTKEEIAILVKLEKQALKLNEISESRRGMEIGKKQLFIKSDIPALIGQDVSKYNIDYQNTYIDENNPQYKRLEKIFENENIVYLRRVAPQLIATISNQTFAFTKNIYGIIPHKDYHKKYLLALLNSKLLDFYYKKKFSLKKVDIFPEIQTYLFELLPIKAVEAKSQQPFIKQADQMLKLYQDLQSLVYDFLATLQANLSVNKVSQKMQKWYDLDFKGLLQELAKQKIKIKLSEQKEWRAFFEEEQRKAQSLRTEIEQTDKEIDSMVYELYDLTEAEIEIIENIRV